MTGGPYQPPWRRDSTIARGSGGGGSQTTVQKQELPAWVDAASQSNYQKAQEIADRPYQANPYFQLAGLTPDQTQAYDTIRGMQGGTQPAFQASQNAITQGGLLGSVAPLTPEQINANTAALMNPYLTSVVDPSVAQMRQSLDRQISGIGAQASNVGAFGGSRLGVEEGIARGEETMKEGQLVGGLLSGGYDRAQNLAAELGAKNLAAGQWATTTLPALATSGAAETAKEAGLLEQSGRAQQGQTQAELDAQAQAWLDQWNYPTENLQILESALSSSPYSTTNIQTGPGARSNVAGNVIGGLGAAAGVASAVVGIVAL